MRNITPGIENEWKTDNAKENLDYIGLVRKITNIDRSYSEHSTVLAKGIFAIMMMGFTIKGANRESRRA